MSYNTSMAKPKSSNRSIRLTDDAWAWLAGEAERRQNSVNGVVADLVADARDPAAQSIVVKPKPRAPTTEPQPILKAAKPAGRVRGFTASGEPIVEPAFVSRAKGAKK